MSLSWKLKTRLRPPSFAAWQALFSPLWLRVLGLLAAVQILPAVILGPVSGLLLDRWDRRKAMVGCELASALIVAAIVIYVCYNLGRRAIAVLLDRAPEGLVESIYETAATMPERLADGLS